MREGDSMNYMIKGIQALKESVFLGIIIYIVIFVLLYLFKKREYPKVCVNLQTDVR